MSELESWLEKFHDASIEVEPQEVCADSVSGSEVITPEFIKTMHALKNSLSLFFNTNNSSSLCKTENNQQEMNVNL